VGKRTKKLGYNAAKYIRSVAKKEELSFARKNINLISKKSLLQNAPLVYTGHLPV